MTTNIIKDLSTLTTVDMKTLESLLNKMMMCMYDVILESCIEQKDVVEMNIGIGTLSLLYQNNEIKYKFKPSAKFEEGIVKTIKTKNNTLDETIDKELKERLVHTYKDLF